MVGHYKTDFILAILDECDDAYVAAYSIQASAVRVADNSVTMKVLQRVLPTPTAARYRLSKALRVALLEGLKKEQTRSTDDFMDLLSNADEALASKGLEALTRHRSTRALAEFEGDEDCEPASFDDHAMVSIESALHTLRTSGWALRLALHRVEVLIREHAHWASEDWKQEEQLAGQRCEDNSRMMSRNQSREFDSPESEYRPISHRPDSLLRMRLLAPDI